MGNTITFTHCFRNPSPSAIKLIYYGGTIKIINSGNKHLAGEIMFDFPDHMLCHADSFIIGHPIPSLSIDDELIKGQTYFLLPLDCFSHNILSVSSLAALGSKVSTNSNHGAQPVRLMKECPFEYIKGSNGRVLIKVMPEFIIRLISFREKCDEINGDEGVHGSLCSTPELKKHYNLLVGSKDQVWSPKLETISEYKIRFSPCRFIGLEWKQKEVET